MRSRLMLFLLVAIVMLPPAREVTGAPVPWPEASFTFIARQQTLIETLTSFARNFGVDLQASEAVKLRSDTVSGKFTMSNPSEFLNQLSSSYGLQWFYYGGTLYVSRNFETATRPISPNGVSMPEFRKALIDLGVVEPKFGWGELADRGVVIVSGPPAYVDIVVWAVMTLPLPQPQQKIRVFRLAHAQVNDRVISYRDQQITTAGVATILRNLIMGQGGSGGTSLTNLQQLANIAAPLRQAGTATEGGDTRELSQGAQATVQPNAPAGNQRSTPLLRPVIQADSRLNAVIVKDIPQHMPIYEELIALLDVPTRLIEIEAVIVDVNSSNVADLGIDWGGRASGVAGGFGRPNTPPDDVTGTIVFG